MDHAIPLDSLISKAAQLIDEKEYKAANVIYSLVQEVLPEHPDCLHGMGVLALFANEHAIAIQLIQRALKAHEEYSAGKATDISKSLMLAHLGRAYEQSGELTQALYSWMESLATHKNQKVERWFEQALGTASKVSDDVIKKINQSLLNKEKSLAKGKGSKKSTPPVKGGLRSYAGNPASEYFDNLKKKIIALSSKQTKLAAGESQRLSEEILRILPEYPDALHWMGIAKHYQGESKEGIYWVKKAITQIPYHPYYLNTLGVICRAVGEIEESITAFTQALQIKPNYAEAGMNLANVLRDEGDLDKAITWYRWAIHLKPDYAEAWNNLGVLHKQRADYLPAKDAFDRAIQIEPKHVKAHLNLGVIAEEQKQRRRAIEMYKKTLALSPTTNEVRLSLIHQQLHVAEWENLDSEVKKLRAIINECQPGEFLPFNFMSLPGITPTEQKLSAELFAASRYETIRQRALRQPYVFEKNTRKRPRLGFLSTDYREHAVAVSVVEMIELLDRKKFEVVGYSYGVHGDSPTRNRLIAAFDEFYDIEPLSNQDSANKIYNDHIDILIDLTGHTHGSRFEIMALHPAPIQVSYLGYSGTTGAEYVEYLIGDKVVTPINHQRYYSENLVVLPQCYFPTDSKRDLSLQATREDEGLPADRFVFCSFNQPYKISPVVWKTWCEILLSVHGSVLWLHSFESETRKALTEKANEYGISSDRIIFAKSIKRDLRDHLSRLRLADLALDTFPYNGHTTTHDALSVDVPVVAILGEVFHSRVSASMLHSLGLDELVATDAEEYKAKIISLANDPDLFTLVKTKLQENKAEYPLFNIRSLTKNIETAMTRMYASWLSGEKPMTMII
jgi:protein O-GlcNAc transferase